MTTKCYGWHILLAALTCALPAAALEVGGTLDVDTWWMDEDSPVVVTGTLVVASNVLLRIDPGVHVQFASGVGMTVQGGIEAIGAPGFHIVFTNHTAGTYGGPIFIDGLDFDNTATGIFDYCDFSLIRGASGALRAEHADLTVKHCLFTGIPSTTVRPVDSHVLLFRNLFHNTAEAINAVYCTGSVCSNVIYNVIGNADAIDIDFDWRGPAAPPMIVEWNNVSNAGNSNADGIDLSTSRTIIRYNTIHDFGDKGISVGEACPDPHIYGNLISGCVMGIGNKDSSNPRIENNTIVNCVHGIRSYEKNTGAGGAYGSVSNTIIWGCVESIVLLDGSVLDVAYSDIEGDTVWPGPGNRNLDPQFRNPAAQDFHLLPGSPAVDGGSNLAWLVSSVDLDLQPRLVGSSIDMGAYELQSGPLAVNFVATPLSGYAPFQPQFQAYTAGTNITGLYYWWDFDGDGTPDTEGLGLDAVSPTYSGIGRFSPSLTVSNAAGEVAFIRRDEYLVSRGPDVVYVSLDGQHRSPFTTWETAATNIHDAVALAFEGTRVVVSDGVYRVSSEIVLREQATLESFKGRDLTVVDGGDMSRCFLLNHADAVVDGFTITRGTADRGGGVYIDSAGGTVRDCIIAYNSAGGVGAGGGVFLNTQGTVVDCTIATNTASDLGGGVCADAGGSILNCVFTGNRSTGNNGGGIFFDSGGEARNCLFTDNWAGNRGGAVYCYYGGSVENCTLTRNTATVGGGGLRLYRGGDVPQFDHRRQHGGCPGGHQPLRRRILDHLHLHRVRMARDRKHRRGSPLCPRGGRRLPTGAGLSLHSKRRCSGLDERRPRPGGRSACYRLRAGYGRVRIHRPVVRFRGRPARRVSSGECRVYRLGFGKQHRLVVLSMGPGR